MVKLKYPSYYSTKLQNILPKYCDIISNCKDKENYTQELSIAPGDFDELMNILQKITNGDFEFNFPNDVSTNTTNNTQKRKKKIKKKTKFK